MPVLINSSNIVAFWPQGNFFCFIYFYIFILYFITDKKLVAIDKKTNFGLTIGRS